jgi:hypothetical protein
MRNGLVIFSLLVLCFAGCKVSNKRASILSLINAYHYYSDSLIVEGYVQGYKYDGFKMIPLAFLNNDTLPMENFELANTDFHYSVPRVLINFGSNYKLKVDYGEGTGEATDTMPGEFAITSPNVSYVLHKGNDLNITWGQSTGAQWYWLHIDLYYYYHSFGYFDFELDTIIKGTSYSLSAGRIFPVNVDSISSGYGSVDIEAYFGPEQKPGSKGNLKGDAVGFFWCSYEASEVGFEIEQYSDIPKVNHQPEIRKRHQEVLRKFALENQ